MSNKKSMWSGIDKIEVDEKFVKRVIFGTFIVGIATIILMLCLVCGASILLSLPTK